jgi:hypothetical protein
MSSASAQRNASEPPPSPAHSHGAYKGRKKTLTPERAAELVQWATKGISRETVYQYLRQAKPE